MSTTEGRLDRENPDDLLNARLDPSGSAFGTHGGEAGSDLNWFKMVRARVAERAASSSRYRWWVLWALLTGLFSLNFTFTVFIVALPKVAGEFHTNVTIQQVWGGPNSGIDGGNEGGKGITDTPGGLKLQCEGHDVRYRNAWIKELEITEPNTDF